MQTQNVFSIIKLEFLLNRKSDVKWKNTAAFCLTLFAVFLASVFLSAAVISCLTFFGGGTSAFGQLAVIALIITVVLFSYSLTLQVKSIFLFKQKEITAYLPISKKEIYVAKFCACLIKTVVLNFVITLPSLIIFGLVNGYGVLFYLTAFAVMLFMPLIPFCLAGILAVPFVYVYNFLKNKPIIKLFVIIAVMIAVLYFYMSLLFDIANVWLLKDSSAGNIIYSVAEFCQKSFLPNSWVAGIMLKIKVKTNLLPFASVSIGMLVLVLLIGTFTYKKIFNDALVEKNLAKTIITKNKAKSVFAAYFNFEIKDLFRRADLLFTCVGMAIVMPFMVYFCDKFIVQFAVEKLGDTIVTGVTLLVILIFVSIICSPSASLISKEGNGFWILKTNPNGIGLPLLAKALVTVCFAGGSLLITTCVVCFSGIIDFITGIAIFGIAFIYIVALICLGLFLNLANPNVFYEYKENVSNVSTHLLISLVFSLLISIFAIIKSFDLPVQTILTYCLIAVSAIAAICVVLLVLTYKRLYVRMEA